MRPPDWRSALMGIDPVTAKAPVTLHAAQLLMSRGLNAEAETAILEFLDSHPDHLQALRILGALLRRVSRWEEAIAPLTRVAQLESARFTQQTTDLSPKMLAIAEAKRVYDGLTSGEIVAHLRATDHRYDLVVAADVLIYFGDLSPLIPALRGALRDPGWFAFTVEMAVDTDYVLQPVRRYAHSRDYLLRAAEPGGFKIRYLEEAVVRFEATQPVRSYVCVMATR